MGGSPQDRFQCIINTEVFWIVFKSPLFLREKILIYEVSICARQAESFTRKDSLIEKNPMPVDVGQNVLIILKVKAFFEK